MWKALFSNLPFKFLAGISIHRLRLHSGQIWFVQHLNLKSIQIPFAKGELFTPTKLMVANLCTIMVSHNWMGGEYTRMNKVWIAYHFELVIDWLDFHLWANRRHWMCLLDRWWFSANHCCGHYLGVVHYLSYYYWMMWRYLTMSYRWCWWCAADDVGYSPTNYSWAMNWSAWPMVLLLRSYKLLHLKLNIFKTPTTKIAKMENQIVHKTNEWWFQF